MTTYSATQFEKAVALIRDLPKDGPVKPSQDDQLLFYGLYKQATVGDNDTAKPGMLDFTGKYKWEAWNKQKGVSSEDAKSKYVEHFLALLEKNPGAESDKLKAEVLAA
ncbi:acyl-CoA-binding protein, ACBP [Rhodotorula toruloides]|uniref:Acyl-CoA-binding protein, ACBP n=1 Tax=Rhodotorula toruloides TaxID=5286 RepID=A0A511KPQ2_RHOTO|nr:acyl-CoA-binding protein, ACBP [Rhodotorula toruloides]